MNLAQSHWEKAAYKVLIDTWWNVNTTEVLTTEARKAVLIDTWWNVNLCIRFIFVQYC